jgi:hypothetical protein
MQIDEAGPYVRSLNIYHLSVGWQTHLVHVADISNDAIPHNHHSII